MEYNIPDKFSIRLHHCRPRFKNDIENILLYMARQICAIDELPNKEYSHKLNQAIKLYPGNMSLADKTINNWRTEISSLLGLIEYTENEHSRPSQLAKSLNESEDLIQFFRYFCFKFQYPGGHLKPHESLQMIKSGVKFKPAKYIIRVLRLGMKKGDDSFGISKEEATHCLFNDLRVVRDQISEDEIVDRINFNRQNGYEYDSSGDVIRYAGDILDYMVLANLLSRKINGYYYLKTTELEVLESFVNDELYFPGYSRLYEKNNLVPDDVKATQHDWFRYVNEGITAELFQADILEILKSERVCNEISDSEKIEHSEMINAILNNIEVKKAHGERANTQEIGNVGEAITLQHEKIRLLSLNRKDLINKIKKIPEHFAVGYDINSFEGLAEVKRLIEVKTTISKNPLSISQFRMTPNEWGSAETYGEAYFIYRLMISSSNISLFVIQDPVKKYKVDKLKMVPRNGVEITYTEKAGYYEKVLA